MADYTIELRNVVCARNIFDFPYPFYDERKRKEFEESFIRHFYFREIGVPSIDRFIHNLRDKMDMVFPYYNELFNTANIEYSVLDNYNVTETFSLKRERTGKTAGFSSSVGQVLDNQKTNVDENRKSSGTGYEEVLDNNKATENATENGDTTVTVVEDSTNTSNGQHSEDSKVTKTYDEKFLDTPQGLANISDSKYLTNVKHGNDETTTENTGTNKVTVTDEKDGTTKTTHKGSAEKEVQNECERVTHSDSTENVSGNTASTLEGEQRTTQDNNTRMENVSNSLEDYELKKKGNIGVDTDADMIQKHINLQKVLKKIELMFFEECEDLFMLVF